MGGYRHVNFVIHSTHELHQLKSLAPPPGRYDLSIGIIIPTKTEES